MTKLEVFVLVTAVILLVLTLEVVRRRRFSDSYALLWIGVGVGALVLGVARPFVDRFSESLGLAYGISLVFTLAFVFLLVVCINLSMHVSQLESRVESLAGEVALLRGPARPSTSDDPLDPGSSPDLLAAEPPTPEG